MSLHQLENFIARKPTTEKMPLLFLGHGSPMNAIEENQFTKAWRKVGVMIPRPTAILTISAHWETRNTRVTAMERPKIIYDFYNFPQALYQYQYPASGDAELAKEIHHSINQHILLDHEWGLDHGTWSILAHLYPNADIPVLQLSLNHELSPNGHYELAKTLKKLRRRGVLILGSGNIVHNLRLLDMRKRDSGFDWAEEANAEISRWIMEQEHQKLINAEASGEAFRLAIPTNEHYLPLLYILGLQEQGDELHLFNNRTIAGSLSMTSLIIT